MKTLRFLLLTLLCAPLPSFSQGYPNKPIRSINESEIKTRFNEIGIIPVGNTPAQARQFLDAEVAKWAKVITTAGVKAEQ